VSCHYLSQIGHVHDIAEFNRFADYNNKLNNTHVILLCLLFIVYLYFRNFGLDLLYILSGAESKTCEYCNFNISSKFLSSLNNELPSCK